MERIVERKKRISKQALVKALALFSFIIFAVCLFRVKSATSFITPEALSHFLEASGLWGPLLFILIYAVSVCFFVPASIPTVLGASVFGALCGFLYGWIGAMAGASGAFLSGAPLEGVADFGICLTKVLFWNFFWGTAIGVIVGIFVLTFFGGALKDVWTSGNWKELLSSKGLFSVVLLVFSFFIPKIIKRIKAETWIRGGR